MSGMKLSDQGVAHIRNEEGSRLTAYRDAKGWSIGIGHYGDINGVPIKKGMTITKEQEEQLLKQDIARFEKAVNSSVKVPLSQNQFDALVGLAYNIGDGAFASSTLVKKLNAGDTSGAAEQFMVWRKSEGKDNPVLFNRRNREREMFLGVGEGKAPNIPTPTGTEEHFYDPPKKRAAKVSEETLSAFAPAQELTPLSSSQDIEPLNPFEQTMKNFDALNGTMDEMAGMPSEPVTPKANYDTQLAGAFGIAPSTSGKIPDYIGDMIKSIYDQTA